MRIEKIINLIKKSIIYFLMVINFFGILSFVFSKYFVEQANPNMSKLEIVIYGFTCIFSISLLRLILKKGWSNLYIYLVLNIVVLIIGLINNYFNLISYIKFSLVFIAILMIFSYVDYKIKFNESL